MSKATKIKHVTKEVLEEFVLPGKEQQIARIISSQGNNLHMAEDSSGRTFLVSMPTKFRKRIWIKRGDFVIIEEIAEGSKVKGEIVNILFYEQIKYIKQCDRWPEEFAYKIKNYDDEFPPHLKPANSVDTLQKSSSGSDDSDDDDDLFINPNHVNRPFYDINDNTDSDDDGEEEDICRSDHEDDDDLLEVTKNLQLSSSNDDCDNVEK